MNHDAVVYFNIMTPPTKGEIYDFSYYDLLLEQMHNLARHSDMGFIAPVMQFGMIPMPNENQKEIEILKASKDFINFWIEHRYVGYEELLENLELLDGFAWCLTGGMVQFRFTTRGVYDELPKAFFYVLDVNLMRGSFVKKP